MKTSIYHFFSELLLRRGYFAQLENIEDFDYPQQLIAGRCKKSFPDMVLRHDRDSDMPGGEIIELKTANSYAISSFNSTIPSAQKSMESLSGMLRKELRQNGELFELSDLRDVYYLIVGRKKATPAPLTKVCLVHGSFFETIPIREVLLGGAAAALKNPSGESSIDVVSFFANDSDEELQARFSATRRIDGAAVKLRFRVMCEVDPDADLMKETKFPDIINDSISFITKLDPSESEVSDPIVGWGDAEDHIRTLSAAIKLASALDDVSPDLKSYLSIGTLKHPSNGGYFLARTSIH